MTKKLKSRAFGWSLLFWLHLAAGLFAQPREIRFEHISVAQGLSYLNVRAMIQDQQGFLWFGTDVGLNKYDGYNFTVYKPDPADSSSLPNHNITALALDHAGRLWIGTANGLSRYQPHTNNFVNYYHDPQNPRSLSNGVINVAFVDQQNQLWIGTNGGGLNRYDERANTFIHYRHQAGDSTSLGSDTIYAIYADLQQVLWVGTADGLHRYEPTTNAFVRYGHYTKTSFNPNRNSTFAILEDRRGVIWIGTDTGLYRYDRATDKIAFCYYNPRVSPERREDRVYALCEDDRGNLWIGNDFTGLWHFEAVTGRFTQYLHDPKNPFSLPANCVFRLYQDRSGILWIAVFRNGLARYDPKTARFQQYPVTGQIHAICEDRDGELWLGTLGRGLYRFNRERTQFRVYPNPEHSAGEVVQALYEDRQGKLWMGAGSGLRQYDRERDRFMPYLYESANGALTEQVDVKTIFEDRAGEIWVGTKTFGLCRVDPTRKIYRHDPATPEELHRDRSEVWAIAEDQQGYLWAGTPWLGIYRLDRNTRNFVHYTRDLKQAGHLNSDEIYGLYADSGGVWIGTAGGGLNHFDPRTGRFVNYTEREGLPDLYVKGILPDGHDNLWLSTDNGLVRFNPLTKTAKTYTVKDGLLNNTLLSGAYHQAKDGRMFFGGLGGAVEFHPDSLKPNTRIPPVAITSFKVFDNEITGWDGPEPLVKLSYRDNFFSFEFATLDFTAPEKNQYAYKLEGFDADWIRAGTRRYANYTDVDPGDYVFRVKGSNHDGVWNEAGAAIKIIITPPFWQTWWFRVSAIAAAAFALFYWHKRRTRALEEKKKALEAQVKERTAFAEALQHALTEVESLKNRLEAENTYLQDEIKVEHNFADIISRSELLKKVLRKVEQVAATEATVLILGESGTGKELLARAVHNLSHRRERPLVKVNCAALPSTLIESELFGHEKGAFTGAVSRKIGRFELADGGTIFLDEIGELPLELQAKLLRILQEGEFERLGGQQTLKVDTRVIAATNRDLQEEIAHHRFREDLYYRLNVFPVLIPPLRERKEDIPLLVNHFVKKYGAKTGKRIETVSQHVITTLQDYDWPGNVRELENVIERAVIVSQGKHLKLDDWLPREQGGRADEPRRFKMEEMERSHIIKVLEMTKWRISGKRGAAQVLGMKPTTLRSRMDKLGIKR